MTRSLEGVSDREEFAAAVERRLAATGQPTTNALVVLRAVDGANEPGQPLRHEHLRAAALLARMADGDSPVGRLDDGVFAVALIGRQAPSATVVADRLTSAVAELNRLSEELASLSVAVSIVEISRYEATDPDTLFTRAIEAVEAEQLWVERARSACLHLVGAAATLHLDD